MYTSYLFKCYIFFNIYTYTEIYMFFMKKIARIVTKSCRTYTSQTYLLYIYIWTYSYHIALLSTNVTPRFHFQLCFRAMRMQFNNGDWSHHMLHWPTARLCWLQKTCSSPLYQLDIRLYQEFGNIYICRRTTINQSQNQSTNISRLEANN